MKKLLNMVLVAVMAVSFIACSNDAKEPATTPEASTGAVSFTAGTYTGEATGHNGGLLTVEVTVSDDKIESVEVKDHTETYGIGYGLKETPVEAIPSQIVEGQTLSVDTVTGATITSAAVVSAVTSALEQAGADVNALKETSEKAKAEDQTIDADVVILGAGAAGLSAALEASNAGASVVVLEKQGIVGGSTTRSGGKLVAAGTKQQEEAGFTGDTAEDLYNYLSSFDTYHEIDADKLHEFTDHALEDVQWLEGLGVDVINVEPIHSSITPWRVLNTKGGGGQVSGIGGQITVPLYDAVAKTDTQFIYNCTADEILMKDGKAVGAKGTMKDGSTVTVNAKGVIIATGGYASNHELGSVYYKNYSTSVPAGNVGDGFTMAEAVCADVYQSKGVQEVAVSFTCGVGINEESGLVVNNKGERVVDEWTYQSHVATALRESGSEGGWYIACSNDPNPTVQYGMTLDSTLSAETVEELAEKMGADPETLAATVTRYNELCDKGVDEDFGKPSEYLTKLEGPYYAIQMNPVLTVTFGGINTDTASHVLDKEGNIIDGLYAAGETAFVGIFGSEYPSCGVAIGSSVHYGRLAGQNAANE